MLEGGEPKEDRSTWRRGLTALVTVRPARDIPKEAWPLLGELWRQESAERRSTRAAGLRRVTANGRWTDCLSLWRGDITRLEAGAIVNAANSGLTGCYIPFHACVDNAIHSAAGPWLREACEQVMGVRGRPEPVGTATATKAFYLPCEYVLHTVGPVVSGGVPTAVDQAALARCYRACLDAARELKLASIAFCAISTGVFGYPKRDAALVSLHAIEEFLAMNHNAPLHVILVAFSQEDEDVCRAALGGVEK
jgi:O-acetyl-ADP-ribose deacetylase (regulator of RNase III)